MSWLWGAEDDESGHARRTRRPRRGSAARSLLALLAVAAVLGAGVLGVVALLRSIEPSAPEATLTCSAGQFSVDVDQAANAALIVGTTVRRDLPARAGTIGIATALQESWMRNIDFGDRDSLGMFQQRPSQGWGTPEQVMDPVYATNIFYDHLVQVDRYTEMAVTEAAQAVQRSGFPDAYAQHEPLARVFASALTGWTEADLTCSLEAHVGDAAYVPEAVLERMERDYGIVGELGSWGGEDAAQADNGSAADGAASNATPTDGGTAAALIDAGALGRSEEATARAAWAAAQGAVAAASETGAGQVLVDGWTWERDPGQWRELEVGESGPRPGIVVVLP